MMPAIFVSCLLVCVVIQLGAKYEPYAGWKTMIDYCRVRCTEFCGLEIQHYIGVDCRRISTGTKGSSTRINECSMGNIAC